MKKEVNWMLFKYTSSALKKKRNPRGGEALHTFFSPPPTFPSDREKGEKIFPHHEKITVIFWF
jgi:hypothetical protein